MNSVRFGVNNYYINKNAKNPLLNRKQISFNGGVSNISQITDEIKISSITQYMNKFLDVIKCYSYGKKSLINNPEGFSITSKNGDVCLENFHQPDKNLKEGICEELTYKAGKELEEKYGDKYIFLPTTGLYQKYKMNHCYITALEKTPKNQENIQKLLEKCNNESEELDILKKEILSEAILIDPSFHTVKQYSDGFTTYSYDTQKIHRSFEDMNPFKDSSYTIPKALIDGEKIPLGYARDIAPDLDINPNKLLWLSFNYYTPDKFKTGICIRNIYGFEKLELATNHPLSKFLKKTSLTEQ